MLINGLKGGNLINSGYMNIIAKTAEQMANVNITSKIKGLSDAGGSNTANYIYHTQIRDRITLISVYVSTASLSSPVYPSINTAVDENGTFLTGSYSFLGNASEEFDHIVDGITYKVTFLKKTYAVAPSGMNKRTKYQIYPMSASAKDFDATYLNSMFVIQFSNTLVGIDTITEGGTSSYSEWNKIKEAFRLNMSYNLICEDALGNYTEGGAVIADYINYINDLYECGGNDVDLWSASRYGTYPRNFEKTVTSGTSFDYTLFLQNDANILKLKLSSYATYSGGLVGALYLTTTDTLSNIINSAFQDALNSYDTIMLNRDFSNRLQGKLYYPTIGNTLVTTGNPELPIELDIVMSNNIDNLSFTKELTLTSGYKLKFSIS